MWPATVNISREMATVKEIAAGFGHKSSADLPNVTPKPGGDRWAAHAANSG